MHIEDFEPLLAGEQALLAGLSSGDLVPIGGTDRPDAAAGLTRQIRAAFLRELVLGTMKGLEESGARVPEKGVRLGGARITGELDLEGCRIPRDLELIFCHFDDAPVLRSAVIDNLFLNGSRLPGLEADRLEARGSVVLRGADVEGTVRLLGATLGGDLSCISARFRAGADRLALVADRINARGSVFLRGADVEGMVRLLGTTLGGDLDCNGARFRAGADRLALVADRIDARGDVFLRGAVVEGEIRLSGATLGGNLACDSARFRAGADGVALNADGLSAQGCVFLSGVDVEGEVRLLGAKLGGDLACDGAWLKARVRPRAVCLNGAKIVGNFFLRDGAKVDGVLDMTDAEMGNLTDEAASWPGPGNLLLDRCRYGAFTGKDIDAEARIRWLSLQDDALWGDDFWPQPWEHLAKVLREMGHRVDARNVLIEKEKRQRRALRARRRKALLFEDAMFASVWDRMLGATVRYGHQPLFAFVWLALFWLVGLFVFAGAEAVGAIKPNQPVVLRGAEWVQCAEPDTAPDPKARLACFLDMPAARSYPGFNAAIYSADTLLPIVDLEMQGYWIPDDRASTFGRLARAYLWLHIALGWALSLLAVAGFSGLIRTDGK